jgi:uncharacterized protein (DUF1330 family)
MAVYMMISYDIHNAVLWQNYPPRVAPILQKYGARVLSIENSPVVLEGNPKMMNALIEFPSEQAALNCYNDPAYAEVKKIRLDSTSNCTMILVKEFRQ